MSNRKCFLAVLVSFAVFASAQGALATDFSWEGDSSSFWNDSNNWDPTGIPDDPSDSASFGSPLSLYKNINNDMSALSLASMGFSLGGDGEIWSLSGNSMSVGGLWAVGSLGSYLTLNNNINAFGNVSFDGDFGAGGTPGLIVEIKGNLVSGGFVSGLYIGTQVIVSNNGSITNLDGDRMDCWGSGSVTLKDNARLTTVMVNPPPNSFTGSFLVGSWGSGPYQRASFTAEDNSVANIANDLITSVWGVPGTITLMDNARVIVGNQVRVGEGGATTNSLTMSQNATLSAGSIAIAADWLSTGAQTDTMTLNDSSRTVTTGNLDINPTGLATNVATLNVNASASLMIGGATTNNGTMNLDSASMLAFNAISGTGTTTIGGVQNAVVAASSVTQGTLTINPGSTLILTGWTGRSGAAINAVPEPSTWVLLSIVALGLIGAAWRRK